MADAGQRLVEDLRRQQLQVRAVMLGQLVETWPLLDPLRLDDTAAPWLRLTAGLVAVQRARSAAAAAQTYAELREVRTGRRDAPPRPVLDWADADAAAAASMRILGPVAIKYATGTGQDPEVAARRAMVRVAGAAGRHVLHGGRSMLHASVDADPAAVGYGRYASATACAFCRMLASRGAVYLTSEAAGQTTGASRRGSGRRYHDECACLPVAMFSEDDPLPPGSQEAEQLWLQSSAGQRSGAEARAEFRRLVEQSRRPAAAAGERRPTRTA